MSETLFKKSPLYKATLLSRVRPYEPIKVKFRQFMQLKRDNPTQQFNKSDSPFTGGGPLSTIIPGLMHAHITQDLSVLYKHEAGVIYLFGFFTHEDLGTGNPGKPNQQKAISRKFANQTFEGLTV